MSQQKAQLISPIDTFTTPGLNVTGVVTSTTFVGNSSGTAFNFTGSPNINAGIVTATTFFGDGSQLTGTAIPAFVGQSTTSQSPTTTINLSLGNVINFTHNTDTTVAFANTSTTQKVKFIRIKDATATARAITWPTNVYWNNGTTPTLINNPRTTSAQTFNLTTRNSGATWYAYEEVNASPNTNTLFSWGYNGRGHLGQNNTTYRSSPVQIPGTTWNSVTMGRKALATKTDGTLWGWGENQRGDLGQNNVIPYSSPVQIPGTTWRSVKTGFDGFHVLATKTDNTLWSMGYNPNGQLGQNNRTDYSSPIQIPGTTWSSIACGRRHSLSIKTDGTLWSWGYNPYGQLGQNNRTYYSSPVQIPGTAWSSISGASQQSLATKTDGTLWSWGYNNNGGLGQNNRTYYSSPTQIPGTTWSSIAAGNGISFATKTDGTLWSWGQNQVGELGQNNTTQYSSPVQIPGTTWSSVSGGSQFVSATKTDNTLWSWGSNNYGGLGQNNTTKYSSPVQIPGTSWSSVSAGNYQTLALQYSN